MFGNNLWLLLEGFIIYIYINLEWLRYVNFHPSSRKLYKSNIGTTSTGKSYQEEKKEVFRGQFHHKSIDSPKIINSLLEFEYPRLQDREGLENHLKISKSKQ